MFNRTTVQRRFALAAPFILGGLGAFALAGCDTDTPAEEAAEQRGDIIEERTDQLEDAGDEVEDQLD